MLPIEIRSPTFENNEMIPEKYTCDGKNINPPLEIKDIPENAKSLVLIVDDPDAPNGTFTHWTVWNIPPTDKIEENSVPGKQGTNDFKNTNYGGPCPPSGDHRYYFKLYALDEMISLDDGSDRETILSEIQDHIIESCNTMGRYQKKE